MALGLVGVGVGIVAVLAALVPLFLWRSDPGGSSEREPLTPPGAVVGEVTLGDVTLPTPDLWWTHENDYGIFKTWRLVPSEATAWLVQTYKWDTDAYTDDPRKMCQGSLYSEGVNETDLGYDTGPGVRENTSDFTVATCSGPRSYGDSTLAATVMLDGATRTALIAITETEDGEHSPEVLAWPHYLTCSAAEQLGVILEDCAVG